MRSSMRGWRTLSSIQPPGENRTLEEVLESQKDQKEKNIYYATDTTQQAQYIQMFKNNGIEPIVLDHPIDHAFISFMEMKKSDVHFKRVDSDISDLRGMERLGIKRS